MRRLFRRTSSKAGLPPGTLVHVGETRHEKVKIQILDYDEARFSEREAESVEDCFPFNESPTVTWINVTGIHDLPTIEKLGTHFGLHPLVMEDVANANQRPKLERYEQYIYMVVRMLTHNAQGKQIEAEQVSLILGRGFVISFQEREGDVFDPIRERIRQAGGRIRGAGADYLAYAMLDSIVDGYFVILEAIGETVEELHEAVTINPSPATLSEIHDLKRELIYLRKAVWPLREAISGLQKEEPPFVTEGTRVYLRDAYDHTIQVMDAVESFRDMVSGMLDTYLTTISNRMNEVMKTLTIMASVFIPLTFMAGIWGMNFEHMPELGWRWSYPLVLLGMLGVAGTMVAYFKRKGWL